MKRKMSFLVAGLLCLSLCLGAEAAGTVTDTLTVRVGYYGMEQDRYVEVATYHWSELYDALPLHYEAYSFFRSTDDGTYNTVIDSAYTLRTFWTTPGSTAAILRSSRFTPATRASAFSPRSPMPTCSARSDTIIMISPHTSARSMTKTVR